MLHREAQFGRPVRQEIIAKAGFYQPTDQLGECADLAAKQNYEENENNGHLEEYECVALRKAIQTKLMQIKVLKGYKIITLSQNDHHSNVPFPIVHICSVLVTLLSRVFKSLHELPPTPYKSGGLCALPVGISY